MPLYSFVDVLKPQPKPTDPEEPSHNIPIFPVLEKSHATERSIDTRLHWMIAEISFTLNKRKSGQMPDQEVNMMIARIKNVSILKGRREFFSNFCVCNVSLIAYFHWIIVLCRIYPLVQIHVQMSFSLLNSSILYKLVY